jgi:spore coat protein U-like protein
MPRQHQLSEFKLKEKKMKKLSIISLALVLTLAMAGICFGATASGTLNVSATVVPTCSVSTTPVNFGNYDSANNISATGDITVTCPSNTPYHIALDAGQNYTSCGWIGALRVICDGAGNGVPYELAQDSTFTRWGDSDYANTYSAGMSLADTGNGAAQSHAVYGLLIGIGTVPPGIYTDVVGVTVYY